MLLTSELKFISIKHLMCCSSLHHWEFGHLHCNSALTHYFYLESSSILASINIGVFLFEIASPVRNSDFERLSLPLIYGAKINQLILSGEWWRLVTPMFLVQAWDFVCVCVSMIAFSIFVILFDVITMCMCWWWIYTFTLSLH